MKEKRERVPAIRQEMRERETETETETETVREIEYICIRHVR